MGATKNERREDRRGGSASDGDGAVRQRMDKMTEGEEDDDEANEEKEESTTGGSDREGVKGEQARYASKSSESIVAKRKIGGLKSGGASTGKRRDS